VNNVVQATVTLKNPSGLHARPASQFVQTAAQFKGTTVKVGVGGRSVDAKSILGLMGLGARHETELLLTAEGPEAEAAIKALVTLVETGFGEL
jgi:phosphocarrier protein HPr